MKNAIFILLLCLIPITIFSQSYTEKYNSLYERYELYDANNNLVSYKKYNSFYQRWEYFEVKQSPNTYQGLKPVDPTNWDLAYQALAYKQQKYDSGKLYTDNQINKLHDNINNNTNLSDNESVILRNSIINAVNDINSKGTSDFSDDSVVNNIVSFIYSRYNDAIIRINNDRQQTANKPSKSNTIFIKDSYNKTFEVSSISVYDKRGMIIRNETIKDKSYILLKENEIIFKRADGTDSFRNLAYKTFNDKIYIYSSEWGDVHIHENLLYIKFFDVNSEEYYKYFIKQ